MLDCVLRMKENTARFKQAFAEDRRGWLICLAVLITTIVRSGVTYSFGMFIVQLEKTYHATLAEQNWIGTLSFAIALTFAPLSVMCIRRCGDRGYRIGGMGGTVVLFVSCIGSSLVNSLEWMFLTHSLLYGVGSSLVYMSSSLVIGEYFDKEHKYHVMATSILLCGYPIGSLLFNPLNAWILTSYGWRAAFRFAGIMVLVTGLPCCWTFSCKPQVGAKIILREQEQDYDGDSEDYSLDNHPVKDENQLAANQAPLSITDLWPSCCTMQQIRDKPEIALWYMGNCISYLGFFMPFVNLAYYMKLKGFHAARSSFAITLLSFAECITYVISSFFGDYLKGRLVWVNAISAGALSIICIVWPFFDVNYPMILMISVAMGGFLGLTIVYTYAASEEVTNLPIDVAWPYTNLWSGIGILLGPFFSGAIFDLRNSYDDVFYVVGGIYGLDVVVFVSIIMITKLRRRSNRKGSLLPEDRGYEDFNPSDIACDLMSPRLEQMVKDSQAAKASDCLTGAARTPAYGALDR